MALFPSLCGAQTIVSGNISGIWSHSGNPYILSDNAIVPSGQTLTIQPGAIVWIGSGLGLTVNGSILAVGTMDQRITFKAPISSQYWNTISVNNSFTNLFNYCDFSNTTNALAFVGTSSNQINYCTFTNAMGTALSFNNNSANQVLFSSFQNVSNGIAMTATVQDNNIPVTNTSFIANCSFSNCSGLAISGTGTGAGNNAYYWSQSGNIVATIKNCTFSDVNGACSFFITQTGYGPWGGGGPGNGNVQIIANLFNTVSNTAISLTQSSGNSGTATLINNTIVHASNGVVFRDPWDAKMQDSILSGCTNAVTVSGSLSRSVSYNDLFNNTIDFAGYPSTYGSVIIANRNGTPCDLLFNIFEDPRFVATNDVHFQNDSPAIDAGSPDWAYTDMCFPPSKGTSLPDLGIYGGPDACNWLTVVPIFPVQAMVTHSNQLTLINWGAIPRSEYQVQYLTNCAAIGTNSWLNFPNGDVLATGKPTSLSVGTGDTQPQMFFRIQSLGRPVGN